METAEKSLIRIYGEVIKFDWHGFPCLRFKHQDGWECRLAGPKRPAAGRPWIWRSLFWDAWPEFDLEMIKRGWYVAFIDNIGLYGNLERMKHLDEFYRIVTGELKLARKPCLEGFSRGGLTAFNWAAAHPDKTLAVYADNPVCDVRSWPGGKGKGAGAPKEWAECLEVFKLDEKSAKSFKGNPLDKAEEIAKAGIPTIMVCGDSDEIVPFEENGEPMAAKLKAAGGRCEVIVKKGCGHHPHSLENPAPLVDFVLPVWNAFHPGS